MNGSAIKSASRWIAFVLSAPVIGLWTMDEVLALPILILEHGSTTITIADNSADDADPLDGVVTFTGSIGTFTVATLRGTSKPFVGSAGAPELQLVSSVDTTTGGTLTVRFSDTDFTALNAGLAFNSSAVFTTSNPGFAVYSTFLDSANVPFGLATPLGSETYGFPIDLADFSSLNLPSAVPYSLTQVVTLVMADAGRSLVVADLETVGETPVSAVSEPGSLMLLGSGLIGLAAWRPRKLAQREGRRKSA